jgi:hypothetical protein
MKDIAYEKPVLIVLDDGYKAASGACNAGGMFGCGGGTSQVSGTCNYGYFANTTCGSGTGPGYVVCWQGPAANCNCVDGGIASDKGSAKCDCGCGSKRGDDCGYGGSPGTFNCCTGGDD